MFIGSNIIPYIDKHILLISLHQLYALLSLSKSSQEIAA